MDRRWVGLDGYEVVAAVHEGRQVLRVRRNGWLVADCRSVEEVARLVDLADLCEVVELSARRRSGDAVEARTSSHHG